MKHLSSVFLLAGALWAGGYVAPVSETAEDRGRVVETVVYEFKETVFSKPRPIEEFGAGPKTPKFLVSAVKILNQMRLGDVDAWVASWDQGGRDFYGTRLAGPYGKFPQRSAARTRSAWKRAFDKSAVLLNGYVETTDFIVVAFEVRAEGCSIPPGSLGYDMKPTKEGLLRSRLVLIKEGKNWVQTGKYASHPVCVTWRTDREQVSRRATASDWSRKSIWPPAK